jgi:MFS family permease
MFGNASGSSRSGIEKPLQVFRHRPFLIFWIGALISNTGNWTENAAQSWAVTTQTAGNPHQGLLVELLQFADFCPVLLLALFAGVIADRVNRKVWLITLQATACALGAGLAVAAFLGRATQGRHRLYLSGRDHLGSQRPCFPLGRAQSCSAY